MYKLEFKESSITKCKEGYLIIIKYLVLKRCNDMKYVFIKRYTLKIYKVKINGRGKIKI